MQCSFNNSVYDHVVWSQMCSLEVIGERYWLECAQDISIVSRNGKYGLIRTEHIRNEDSAQLYYLEHVLCDCHYDTIYNLKCEGCYGQVPSGCFVVFSCGKCGIIEVRCSDDEVLFECRESVACLFDSIEIQCNENIFLLYCGKKVRYYNLNTKFLSPEYESISVCGTFLSCIIKGRLIIIDAHNDKRFVEELE